MKHYKLSAWPDLPSGFRRTGYTRMLSALSHHPISADQLQRRSCVPMPEVQGLLRQLAKQGLLQVTEVRVRPLIWRVLVRSLIWLGWMADHDQAPDASREPHSMAYRRPTGPMRAHAFSGFRERG